MPSARSTTVPYVPRASRRLREAATAWLAGAERGEVRNRSGDPYKPSTLRGYRQALEERILPLIGGEKLSAITTYDLQLLVDRWHAEDDSASTLRNTIKPLQAIYRRAKSRGGLPVNPTQDLELPAPRARKVEIVAPEVAAELLAALPIADQAVWGTALYAGLRYGELRALRWSAVDFVAGTVAVRESWDPKAGLDRSEDADLDAFGADAGPAARAAARSPAGGAERAGERARLRPRSDSEPFHAATLYRRADSAWAAAGLEERLRLHQARHTYASFMIARRRQRQGARAVHGPLLDQADVRPLRASDAGIGAGGGCTARCVSRRLAFGHVGPRLPPALDASSASSVLPPKYDPEPATS